MNPPKITKKDMETVRDIVLKWSSGRNIQLYHKEGETLVELIAEAVAQEREKAALKLESMAPYTRDQGSHQESVFEMADAIRKVGRE